MHSDKDTTEIRAKAALELMRHKMLLEVNNSDYPRLDIKDINEILIVANLPVIVPEELQVKEVEVVKLDKED